MSLSRRALVQGGAAALALGGVGAGVGYQRWRWARALESAPIAEPWAALGPQMHWLRPNLQGAPMAVPDRPHRVEEARDDALRRKMKRVRRFTVDTNADRLRGPAIAPKPAAGVLRIAAVGDSVTFGWGEPAERSYPALLQAELQRRGRVVEVLNCGVPGQMPQTMARWLSVMGPQLGVEGFIFTRRVAWNGPNALQDYVQSLREVRRGLPRARGAVVLPPISRFDAGAFFQDPSTEAVHLHRQLRDLPVFDLTSTFRAAQGARGYGLRQPKPGVLTLVDEASGAVIAEAPADGPNLPWDFCARIDDDPALREPLFFDSGHPDAEGFALFASAVADQLEAAGWFPA